MSGAVVVEGGLHDVLISSMDNKKFSETPLSQSTPPRKPKKVVLDRRSPIRMNKHEESKDGLHQSLLNFIPEDEETLPAIETPSNVKPVEKEKKPSRRKPSKKPSAKASPQKPKEKLQQSTLIDFGIRRTARQQAKAILEDREQTILRKLRDGVEENMKVVMTEVKGRGVIAASAFHEGDFVVEYAGDLITEQVARRREAEYKQDPTIGSYMFFFQHGGKKWCVDATAESGKFGRLINHSRLSPNCIVKIMPIDDVPRLALVAKRRIDPGEELLYDYGDRDKETLKIHPWLAC